MQHLVEPTICNFLTIVYEDSKSALMLRVRITLSDLLEVHTHVSIGTLLVCEVRPTHPLPTVDNDSERVKTLHICAILKFQPNHKK